MIHLYTGEDLRRLRHRLGLTQAALAEKIGTSQPHIADLENGRTWPSYATLVRYQRLERGLFDRDMSSIDIPEKVLLRLRRQNRAGEVEEFVAELRADPRIIGAEQSFARAIADTLEACLEQAEP